jgi:hypothetical protein
MSDHSRANYSLAILLILSTVAFDTLFIFIFSKNLGSQGLIALIPGSPAVELSILMLSPFLSVPLISFLFAKLMLKLYPKLGRKLKSKHHSLGLYLFEKPKTLRMITSRTLFASFFALAVGLFTTQGLLSLDLQIFPQSTVGSITATTYLLLPIAAILIPPLGWLDDLGVVLYKKMKNHADLPDFTGVGQYLAIIYRGFAGITTPLLFIIVIIREVRIIGNVIEIFLVMLFPLFLSGYFVPMEWLIARWRDKHLDKIAALLVQLKHLGIEEIDLEMRLITESGD